MSNENNKNLKEHVKGKAAGFFSAGRETYFDERNSERSGISKKRFINSFIAKLILVQEVVDSVIQST